MSNGASLELSIKEYATQKGKTVQAVYQQMKRKENAAALEGHIFTKQIGNKEVKYLDAEAIAILDRGSQTTPVVIEREDLRFELEVKTQDLDLAQKKIIYQEGQIQALKEMLAEKEEKLLTLAESESLLEASKKEVQLLEGFIQDAKSEIDVLTNEKAVLSAENIKKDELLSNERKTSQKALDELTAIKGKWWYKLFAGKQG